MARLEGLAGRMGVRLHGVGDMGGTVGLGRRGFVVWVSVVSM